MSGKKTPERRPHWRKETVLDAAFAAKFHREVDEIRAARTQMVRPKPTLVRSES